MAKEGFHRKTLDPIGKENTTDGGSLDGKGEWIKAPPFLSVVRVPRQSKNLFLACRTLTSFA